jgi:hypothetical protein
VIMFLRVGANQRYQHTELDSKQISVLFMNQVIEVG